MELKSDVCVCSEGRPFSSMPQGTDLDFHGFLCVKCGLLRPYFPDRNFFALLGLSPNYDLDLKLLHKNYINRQLFFHPDRWLSKSDIAQAQAAHYSSAFNEAYKTLSCPFLRASYLLSLKEAPEGGENIKKAPSGGDGPDLLSFFTLRERLEAETSLEARSQTAQTLSERREALKKNLIKAFDEGDMACAASLVEEERFLTRALETLRP